MVVCVPLWIRKPLMCLSWVSEEPVSWFLPAGKWKLMQALRKLHQRRVHHLKCQRCVKLVLTSFSHYISSDICIRGGLQQRSNMSATEKQDYCSWSTAIQATYWRSNVRALTVFNLQSFLKRVTRAESDWMFADDTTDYFTYWVSTVYRLHFSPTQIYIISCIVSPH